MRIAIFGAGGVGGYFGGRLAASGQDVTFIARGATLAALRGRGLVVESVNGGFEVSPAPATDDPSEVGAVDAVIVAVKAWQVPAAAGAIRPLLGPDTVVVPLENGVEAPGQLAAALGPGSVAGGVCHIVAFQTAPGRIRHPGLEPTVAFGELDGRRSERLERLQQAFAAAGVKAAVAPDITVAIWEKFLFIASLSGLGAVTRAPAGVVRALPETRAMTAQALEEIAAVARAHRVRLPADAVARTMAFIDALPADATASMQRDIIAGRPSELEAQNGAVVRLGAAAGVPTPVAAFIYAALLPQERAARASAA
ncbi:MAG: 2-dehydropantoate 2-reductase [Thermoanaerobaculaceae bacterium]|nr:2-dehydropantoate 2-reductase [Thermoanaerobaculaceae bacterium]